ncbi:MAG: CPBP family intramembrane metalloprotease, partial [Chlorobiaceae bacterium]|nr:CPBP family intramembrane metalloprotease [Chlorobiaceae bacterium]
MQRYSFSDVFPAQRPSFLVNTIILAFIMVLYSVAGELLFWLINGE